MTAEQLFSLANPAALVGWLILIAAVITKRDLLRDRLAGFWWPLGLSAAYSVLIVFFFFKVPGGFDTLANVKLLFTSDWVALAGWVHYLAFDLLVGSWIAREVMQRGQPRLLLVPLLPLTFMFGPAGFLAFHLSQLLLRKTSVSNS